MKRTLEIPEELWSKVKQIGEQEERSAAFMHRKLLALGVLEWNRKGLHDPLLDYMREPCAVATEEEDSESPDVPFVAPNSIPNAVGTSNCEGLLGKVIRTGKMFSWNTLRQAPPGTHPPVTAQLASHPSGNYFVDLEQGLWWSAD